MRVGIATFQWADNYGAVLQAYALQTFLQSCGHEVEIVDYRPRKESSLIRRWLSASPRGCVLKWEANWKKTVFEKFRLKHLVRTPDVFRSSSDLCGIGGRYELAITGSDQVWNPRWLAQVDGLSDLYFLSFAGPKTRRISYAASIGHSDVSTIESKWRRILGCGMSAMDAISVREQSAIDVVRQLSGRSDVICVADPTLLLDRAHYEELARFSVRKSPYLFSYMLHGMEGDGAGVCRMIAGRLGMEILQCDTVKTDIHAGYTLPTPEKWLGVLCTARFVVTNSFHCTVFCLIYHIPFVAILVNGVNSSMNGRITDLLTAVGLKERIVMPDVGIPSLLATAGIDWDCVDQAVALMREKGIMFLSNQIVPAVRNNAS